MVVQKLKLLDQDKQLVNISFEIKKATALVGQSGSGKSLTLKTILNLVPNNLKSEFKYKSDFELIQSNIGFIPQNPFTSLSPLTKIDKQFFCDDTIKKDMLKLVGLDEWVLDRFPSQLSGGQLQRVVIAIALSTKPKLLLLDEPTTALDTNTKSTILELLNELQSNMDILMLFITHDISSVKNLCENIIILKDGLIVESGKTKEVLENPQDDYTKKLISSGFENLPSIKE